MAIVLEKLETETLGAISDARGYRCDKRKPTTKEMYITFLIPDITLEGIKQFVGCLKVIDLKSWTKKISKSILTSRNQNNSNSGQVLKKRLIEQMAEKGPERFLNKLSPSKTTLLTALKRMGLTPTSEDREELRTMLQNEILMFGLEAFFNEFSVRKLQSMASEMGLSIPTSSKQILVSCIASLANYDPPVRPKKKKTTNNNSTSKKKKNEDDIGNETLKKYPFDYEFSATDEENFVFSSKDEESDESIVDGSVVSSDDDVEMGKE